MRRVSIGYNLTGHWGPWLTVRVFPFFKLQAKLADCLNECVERGRCLHTRFCSFGAPLDLHIIFAKDMSNFEGEMLLLASIRQHSHGLCT
jgi:hypothetical protein